MPITISQVDITSDSTSPEFFVQIRVPAGDAREGEIRFYNEQDVGGAGDQLTEDGFSIDLANDTPSSSFSQGGFDYYTFQITTTPHFLTNFTIGNDFQAVGLFDGDGDVQQMLVWGNESVPSGMVFSGGSLDGQTLGSLNTQGVLLGGGYQSVGGNGNAGSFIVDPAGNVTQGPANPNAPACFATGTLIATPDGERAVETLEAGDLVTTASGAAVAVTWIGRQTLKRPFAAMDHFAPVEIAAGAIADGVPHSPLWVSVDHGMLVDGAICHAGALVNGTTIRRPGAAELGDTMVYWHIETASHEIVLANGAPAETFIDNVRRESFDNHAEFVDRFGADVPEMEELPLPRALNARQVPARVRARLSERAALAAGGRRKAS